MQQKVLYELLLTDDKKAAIVEVNSETDFVAKNDTVPGICRSSCSSGCRYQTQQIWMHLWQKHGLKILLKTVKEALVEKIAVIGENLNIRRFQKETVENGCVVSYIHGGGRIGVLVEAETDVVNDAVKEALDRTLQCR